MIRNSFHLGGERGSLGYAKQGYVGVPLELNVLSPRKDPIAGWSSREVDPERVAPGRRMDHPRRDGSVAL